MRPSTTSARTSHAPSSSQSQTQPPPSAAQLARLADKKKEFEAVDALQRASALFLRRLEGLADDCEAMAEAGIGASLPLSFSPSSSSLFFYLLSCVAGWFPFQSLYQ